MQQAAPPLLPLLRSAAQGRILAAVLLDPETEHTVTEIAALADTSLSTATREINRAAAAGIVRTRTVGASKLARAHTSNPAFRPLAELMLVAFGPATVVAQEFDGLAGIQEAYLFGSWAARYAGEPGRAPNDIDVLIIGEVDRAALHLAATRAEERLHRPLDVTVRTPEAWHRTDDAFLDFVRSRPLLRILPPDERS